MVGAVQQSSAGMEQQEVIWKMAEKAINETNMEEKEHLFALLLENQEYLSDHLMILDILGKLNLLLTWRDVNLLINAPV